MTVLAVIDELLFRAKVEAAASQMGVVLHLETSASSVLDQLAETDVSLVLLDLNLSTDDPIALIRHIRQAAPQVRIIGYCSHIQTDLKQRAHEAGCPIVMPRSQFVQQLPALFHTA